MNAAKMSPEEATKLLAHCDQRIYEVHATIELLRLTIQGMERGQVSYSGHFAAGLDSLISTAQENLETLLEALLAERTPATMLEGGAR